MFPSTISSYVLLIAKAVEEEGYDSEELFRSLDMDPAGLSDPNMRYSFDSVQNLWIAAAKLTKDDCFGLKAAQQWHPTTLHALGYAWFASDSLKDALERMVRYIRMVSTAAKARLDEDEQGYRFILEYEAKVLNFEPVAAAVEAAMAILVSMCRLSFDSELNPLMVCFKQVEPACSDRLQEYFQSPIYFEQPENGILFSHAALEMCLPTANAVLAGSNDRLIKEYLARLDKSILSTQVRAHLLELLPSGHFNEERMASLLNVSLRSLQRKLKEEETSFKVLLEDTRCELAKNYINDSSLSISEITYLLGFSEPSNFTRAFKRWQGMSPSAYREGLQQLSV